MSAPLSSMTGFARATGEADWGRWSAEAKSVNGRGLDVRVSLPAGLEILERAIKAEAGARFKRGSLQVAVRVELAAGAQVASINEALLDELVAAWRNRTGIADRPDGAALAQLISVRGVVETAGADLRRLAETPEVMAALETTVKEALDSLQASRLEEGRQLGSMFSELLDELRAGTVLAGELASEQPGLVKARLERQLMELQASDKVDPDRLAAELALTAAKADVREELDRLAAHLDTAHTHLQAGSPIGRKLDFLAQEMGREANTLCAKSASLDLTNAGLALKGLVEQFKEQAANVE